MPMAPDRRFADVTGLGEFKQLVAHHRVVYDIGRFITIFLGVAVAIPLWILLGPGEWPTALASAIVLDLILIVVGWRFWRDRNKAVALFDRGFAYHDGSRLVQARWDEIEGVRMVAGSDPETGATWERYFVRSASGEVVELPSSLRGFRELWQVILENAPNEAPRKVWG